MPLDILFAPLPPLTELERRWRHVEQGAQTGFFLTWSWIGSWLETTGARPELMAVQSNGRDVALALVGRSLAPRLLGRAATLWLNQAGDPAADRAFIEYNGLLVVADAPTGAHAAAMRALLARNDWRALRIAAVVPDHPLLAHGCFRRRIRTDQSPAYFVDLEAVRGAGGDYLSLISANTRSQIRRAAKEYGASDAVVRRAAGAEIASWLADMATLNRGRHADNAWDDPQFRDFVARLCRCEEVELLRVERGDQLLGLLVNFVQGGRAMNYQSAFADPPGPKGKPGLLTHVAAIEHYAGRGLSAYSLLAGKDRYKQSLSTGAETLEWWTLERFSPRLEAEALLRRLLRRPASA